MNSINKLLQEFPHEMSSSIINYIDLELTQKADSLIAENQKINRRYFAKNFLTKSNVYELNELRVSENQPPFVPIILCGGSATRMGGSPKALHTIRGIYSQPISLLEINIKQIIKFEKNHYTNLPIILYTDFYTHKVILEFLKNNNYFLKNPEDFYFIDQKMSFRYIPSNLLLKNNNYKNQFKLNDNISNLFISENLSDTLVGCGHFIFNSLINSVGFKSVLTKYKNLETLVISNIANVGQKYFPNLLNPNYNRNYILVCKKLKGEVIDSVFFQDEKILIKPHFICTEQSGDYSFTATSYIQIKDVLSMYGVQNISDYVEGKQGYNINTDHYLVLKELIVNGIVNKVVHLENVLAGMSEYLHLNAVAVDRNQAFHSFKGLSDFNNQRVNELKKSIRSFEYI